MNQITILPGPERRRRWGEAERARILEAAFAPGASVSSVARRFDVATSLIYKWRTLAAAEKPEPVIFPAVVTEDAVKAAPRASGPAITVGLADGVTVRIEATAPVSLVTTVLRALR